MNTSRKTLRRPHRHMKARLPRIRLLLASNGPPTTRSLNLVAFEPGPMLGRALFQRRKPTRGKQWRRIGRRRRRPILFHIERAKQLAELIDGHNPGRPPSSPGGPKGGPDGDRKWRGHIRPTELRRLERLRPHQALHQRQPRRRPLASPSGSNRPRAPGREEGAGAG